MIESVEVVIKQSGHVDRVVRLSEGATRLGRAEDNEVVLSDVGVSRRHAQVYVSRAEVTVEDLGSGNGTYYNGYRISSQPVQNGDEIVIDPFILQFRIRVGGRAARSVAAERGPGQARLEVGTSSFPITPRGLSIGRSEDRDVVINDPAASRHHCQIATQGGEFVLRDMGSANGIYVNAERVRECVLADGDVIRIGNTELRFARSDRAAGESRPLAAPAGNPRPISAVQREPTINGPSESPVGAGARGIRGPAATRAPSGHRSPQPASHRLGAPQVSSAPDSWTATKPAPSWVPIVFGGALLFAVVVVGVMAVVAVMVFVIPPNTEPQADAHPPRWELTLPEGLKSEQVPALFQAGQDKMRDRDHRGALQDFYRVLDADPSYPYVDKFAFAAGEYLVLEVLQKEFAARAAERVRREADRDRLLKELTNGNRSAQLRAEKQLKRVYSDDPKVIDKLKLTTSQAAEKAQELADQADTSLKNNQFDDATEMFTEVVATSKDPQLRTRALASLNLCQKEVARASAPKWTEAVLAEASGDAARARELFQEIKEEHRSNPSPKLHLERLR